MNRVRRASSAPRIIIAAARRLLVFGVATLCGVAALASAQGTRLGPAASSGVVIVHPAFGGEILGYDIDQAGDEGLLSESVTLGIGEYLVATETFDQKTGQIVKVVAKEDRTQTDDFVTQGIFFNHVGLDLFQHNGQDHFLVVNPLDSNKFAGVWTPPVKPDYTIWEISVNQQTPKVAVLQVTFDGSPISYVFGSNIASNTFSRQISLEPISRDFQFPLIAFDSKKNRVVLSQTGICANCTPHIALVNLATGAMGEMLGLGIGSTQGLAVDPSTGTACTTTTIDQNVEFYNLDKRSGIIVHLPGSTSEIQSGQDVEFDGLNHVFLVQQYTSTGDINDPQPRIYVYDERGNLKETVALQERIPVSPVRIAINPSQRMGYIVAIVEPQHEGLELQSFTY